MAGGPALECPCIQLAFCVGDNTVLASPLCKDATAVPQRFFILATRAVIEFRLVCFGSRVRPFEFLFGIGETSLLYAKLHTRLHRKLLRPHDRE